MDNTEHNCHSTPSCFSLNPSLNRSSKRLSSEIKSVKAFIKASVGL